MTSFATAPANNQHAGLNVGNLARTLLGQLLADVKARSELHRQRVAFERLDDRLRADIGLPPKSGYDDALRSAFMMGRL